MYHTAIRPASAIGITYERFVAAMDIPTVLLEYVRVVIWPLIIAAVIFSYGRSLVRLLEKSKVKVSLFGVDVEVDIGELARTLTAAAGGALSERQWRLLEDIAHKGSVSVHTEGYKLKMGADLDWIRPIRNAGLVMSVPDGQYIEQATDLILTPLGTLLLDAKRRRRSGG